MALNLFELEAVLRLNTEQYEQGLADAEKKGTGFINGVANTWTKAKSKIQTVTTILQPVTNLVEDVIDSYANYQQMTGGIYKLFGESASKVIENSKQAFRNAGLSMNGYMEMATTMASSLIQDFKGDTEKAADYVEMAIRDMADNMNTFGTSVEAVQNAYSGLSRGNYTMLDNLRLGYKGTAEEMYRLMQDAAELDEEFANSAIFGMDSNGHLNANYADMVRAIHIIQQNMGITGTTENEAATTLSGSRMSMQAALENLKTIMGDPNATEEEKQTMVSAFNESLSTYLKNMMPIITTAVRALISVITQLIPELLNELTPLIPKIAEFLVSLLTDQTLLSSLIKALAYAIVVALASVADVLLTALIGIFDKNFQNNGSAFKQWGVYDWLQKAFGYDEAEIMRMQEYKGLQQEQLEELQAAAEAFKEGTEEEREVQAGYDSSTGKAVVVIGDTTGEHETLFFDSMEEATQNLNALAGSLSESDLASTFEYGGHTYEVPEGDTAGQWLNLLRGFESVSGWELNQSDIETFLSDLGGHLTEFNIPQAEMTVTGVNVRSDNVTFGGTLEVNFGDVWDYFPRGWSDGEDSENAKGLLTVPYDNYLASLHRGEMVLTASQARDYRDGEGGGTSAIVAAIERLSNDMQNLKIFVGKKVFGQTVVDYSGRQMNGYLGKAEDKMIAGYGWG